MINEHIYRYTKGDMKKMRKLKINRLNVGCRWHEHLPQLSNLNLGARVPYGINVHRPIAFQLGGFSVSVSIPANCGSKIIYPNTDVS